MKAGETLTWKFPEMDIEFPVKIGNIETTNTFLFTGMGLWMENKLLLR